MAQGRPLAPLTISPTEREELVSITRSRSMPQALATRARIVLLAADGHSNTEIAEKFGLSNPTVGIWRKRYLTQRLPGLYDEPRPGGPRSIRDEQVATLIRRTLKTKPKDGTHWTCRSIAAETKLSKSAAASPPGIPAVPTPYRSVGAEEARRPSHRRQLRHPQARDRPSLAGHASPLPRPLHPDLLLLAQPGRDLVQHHHPARHPSRHLSQRPRPRHQDRALRPAIQPPLPALRVDRYTRLNPRKDRAILQSCRWDRTLGVGPTTSAGSPWRAGGRRWTGRCPRPSRRPRRPAR